MHWSRPLSCLVPLLGAMACGEPEPGESSIPPAPRPFDLAAMDRSADPCVDFYQFSCGGWMKSHPVPPDRSRFSRFDLLADRNEAILRDILDRASNADPKQGAGQQKIGDFYAACMDEAAIEEKGATPLAAELARIAALGAGGSLEDEIARLHAMGVDAFFSVGSEQDLRNATSVIAAIDQGGLGLPDRDDYTREDPKSAEVRKRYLEHIEKMLTLLGDAPEQAAASAGEVMRIEMALARASLRRVERREPSNLYHTMTVAELAASSPAFDWQRYFAEVGAPPLERLNVRVPAFAKEMSALLGSEPRSALVAYLRFRLLDSMAPYLSSIFVSEDFAFYGKTLRGTRELRRRWKRCVDYTDSSLGEALGRVYVERTFGAEGKARTLGMVEALEGAFRKDIEGLTWMTGDTKARALEKLGAITNKIGYPERWRDYSAYRVLRGDFFGNVTGGARFELHHELAKIGKPPDKGEWEMTPPTVNAYYNPRQNSINFPAGILQPPFYSSEIDDAVNFGGIGAVIGHELTHGFDDEGRRFDAEGNLRDWWTSADAAAFEERARCFVEEYGAFTSVGDVKLSGELTLGENIADNGGLRLALMALSDRLAGREAPPIEGFTQEQRLFVSWGQTWCENRTAEQARILAFTDPHAPGKYRVNGVVANMPEFARAFQCSAGQPMVRRDVCQVW